ncbi:aldo/keto reductase [Elstera cyanobacteriorum]|uniref:Protein tas n=1 Tax=Elstera cyanobacteriorum TaxID=2022747 RepID=A0A255XLP6_9PROT|nr:NADP(H)-dependent aldo-keto reductase [Elstera cyanobacteriorum]OYQ17842.1 NADP(H)-dependent aldo-keto reductase [Elstera cyanobacteriorum]GFZ85607.1 aldo/keto reductase [Elstera cyanobacteriorum]
MELRRLGRTDVQVSLICLGTMTWGEQNTEAEAHAQLDFALDRGINFIDTAEMYPVPPRAETQGRTEAFIGTWLAKRPAVRDKIVLATKVAGGGRAMPHVRGENRKLDRANINAAIDASLKRLHTDYVDLYQIHWPDRATNMFGQLGYVHTPSPDAVPIEDTLAALADLVTAGKIRAIGLSNETPWGVHRFLRAAETLNLPRVVSIQNPYSLLNRSFEVGLAEMAIQEDVGLLAYSPLAMGVLAGKYFDGARPAGARLTLFDRFTRYFTPQAEPAAKLYVDIARRHGIDPAHLALAYVNSRPFVTSNIIGATTLEQLETNIASAAVTLSDEVLAEIEAAHQIHPYPCP